MKFGRKYKISIEANDGTVITIELPFTIEFSILRNTLSSANVCSFRIYNLSERTRRLIRKDQFDFGLRKTVIFSAGYENNFSACLTGNATRIYSVREGTNFVTTIEAFDGGYAYINAELEKQYPKGYNRRTAILDIIKSLDAFDIQPGVVGQVDGKFQRGASFSGNAINILKEISGAEIFIDNQAINVLNESEILKNNTYLINSESGLLSTPILDQTHLTFDMLFEPSIKVGGMIKLSSKTEKIYNSEYKVKSIHHKGVISEAVCGNAVTTVGTFYGSESFKEVSGI